MNPAPGAVSLARALLSLSRGHCTGVLTVCSPYDVCRIAIANGVPRAALGKRQGASLGDVLLRSGDLDAQAHLRALDTFVPGEPVGAWLVRSGVVSRPALEHGLRSQLRARILEVFRFHPLDYSFVAGGADVGVPWIAEPISTPDLVLSAMRAMVDRAERARVAVTLRHGVLTLSPLGRALLDGAALWPDEAALLPLLERGADFDALRKASAGSERALTLLCALSTVSAVVPRGAQRTRYQLLLRKERQLRHNVSATELLDLPHGAPESDARRALRALARTLHPDAFGPDVPELLRTRSNDLMSALGRAEREVRERTATTRRRAR